MMPAAAPAPIGSRRPRFVEIDALRGVAAIWVMVYHYVIWYPDLFGPAHGAHLNDDTVLHGVPNRYLGALPVYLFFIISGFVVVWSLQGARTWRDFAVSRFSRLFPAYWVAVGLTALVGLSAPLPGQQLGLFQVLVNLTMVQDVFGVPHVDGVYWSLLVELIFYLLLGTLIAARLTPQLDRIFLVWAICCLATSLLEWTPLNVPWKLQKYGLLEFGHFLIAGAMLFQIFSGRRVGFSYAVIGLCVASMLLRLPIAAGTVSLAFVLVFQAIIMGRAAVLRWRPLVWLGGISYTLYLTHQMIGFRIIASLEALAVPHLPAAAIAAIVMLSVATTLHYTVELPAMRAMRQWWRGIILQSPRLAPAAARTPVP